MKFSAKYEYIRKIATINFNISDLSQVKNLGIQKK